MNWSSAGVQGSGAFKSVLTQCQKKKGKDISNGLREAIVAVHESRKALKPFLSDVEFSVLQ